MIFRFQNASFNVNTFFLLAQTTDSGKYMVRATNAGGEAKSIADCAILEPSPERLQEVVKTIVYETGPVAPASEFKTEVSVHVLNI